MHPAGQCANTQAKVKAHAIATAAATASTGHGRLVVLVLVRQRRKLLGRLPCKGILRDMEDNDVTEYELMQVR
jgi:hypothetical protein